MSVPVPFRSFEGFAVDLVQVAGIDLEHIPGHDVLGQHSERGVRIDVDDDALDFPSSFGAAPGSVSEFHPVSDFEFRRCHVRVVTVRKSDLLESGKFDDVLRLFSDVAFGRFGERLVQFVLVRIVTEVGDLSAVDFVDAVLGVGVVPFVTVDRESVPVVVRFENLKEFSGRIETAESGALAGVVVVRSDGFDGLFDGLVLGVTFRLHARVGFR